MAPGWPLPEAGQRGAEAGSPLEAPEPQEPQGPEAESPGEQVQRFSGLLFSCIISYPESQGPATGSPVAGEQVACEMPVYYDRPVYSMRVLFDIVH